MKTFTLLLSLVLSVFVAAQSPVTDQELGLRGDTTSVISDRCAVRNPTRLPSKSSPKKPKKSEESKKDKRSDHHYTEIGPIVSKTKVLEVIRVDRFTAWEKLCLLSGGNIHDLEEQSFLDDLIKRTSHQSKSSRRCINWAGFDGIPALYEDADPCAQQDNADRMITFAKKRGGEKRGARIANAIQYRRLPRRVTKVLGLHPASPYCQKKPKNWELEHVWNSQVDDVHYGVYGGPRYPLIVFGAEGSCPWGQRADVETCRCISERPIPDRKYVENCASTCRVKFPFPNSKPKSKPKYDSNSRSKSSRLDY